MTDSGLSIDSYYLAMLPLIASRATCPRRRVAAILVDSTGRLVSIGYNGVPAGMPHCIDHPCPGATDKSGNTTRCIAIHAEVNALSQARASRRLPYTLYCSTTPCFECAKMLITDGIQRVVATSAYTNTDGVDLLHQAVVTVDIVQPLIQRPTVICLCGSTRFFDVFKKINYDLTLAGNIILSVGCDMKSGDGLQITLEQKIALDELHKRKIDLADEILVLNVNGYIGDSTRSEIAYAMVRGKRVRYLEDINI